MITKEEIIDILKMYSGYIDRSCSDKAVHEDNFDAVAYEIESKLHQPIVISAVCDNDDCGGVPKYCEKCYEIESQFRNCY